jgi:hypothetical protein
MAALSGTAQRRRRDQTRLARKSTHEKFGCMVVRPKINSWLSLLASKRLGHHQQVPPRVAARSLVASCISSGVGRRGLSGNHGDAMHRGHLDVCILFSILAARLVLYQVNGHGLYRGAVHVLLGGRRSLWQAIALLLQTSHVTSSSEGLRMMASPPQLPRYAQLLQQLRPAQPHRK